MSSSLIIPQHRVRSHLTGGPADTQPMIALRDTILAGTFFTLIFANSLNIAAQETTISTQESKKLADTFDQRYPANQLPTPEPAERTSPKRELTPALPPAEAPARPSVDWTPAEASSDK